MIDHSILELISRNAAEALFTCLKVFARCHENNQHMIWFNFRLIHL
ncbi:hypothetical protein V6Z12_D05G049200 [Gossypium hirsutum]